MRQRRFIWILLCLLCGAGVWFLWNHAGRSPAPQRTVAPTPVATRSLSTAVQAPGQGKVNTNVAQISLAEWNTNKFAGRLSNTTKTIGQLVNDGHAILLANALIDTTEPLNFVFPKNLQPQGDPGAYIVQARGPIDNAFRAMLAGMGATIVSYIPNDAYLVRADAGVAGMLGANSLVQAVIPYEPYYKIQSSLLYPAVSQLQMPDDMALNLGLFADDAPATIQQIEKLGGQVMGQDRSPFGPIVRVIPPRNWTTLATLSGVQIVEPSHARSLANDLSRATVGVAADSLTATNYLNLTGTNVIVEVNDTGIDAQHPDLTTARVFGDAPQSLTDTAGHGTHVAGIIAGSGLNSPTVTNAPGSTLVGGVGSAGQFRGMAPGATLYSVGGIVGGLDPNLITDQYFQEVPARTNALISNNSWVFEGDSAYDLFAASYDAAVRDALPEVTGSQPVLFVFAAGNAGNGQDDSDFGGGIADSIESPATAKNVITVGAIQEDRNITATVTNADGTSGQPWQAETSTGYRVAGFSSRGNVGIGIEGTFGRYKPDVCAPGTFIISTRSEQWDINSYFYQNPTNDQSKYFSGFIVQPGSIVSRPFPFVPSNAVELQIWTFPNGNSPGGFAVMPTLIGLFGTPGYQFSSINDPVTIPPGPPTLQQILSTEGFLGGFNFAISNNTANRIVFDLQTDIITTNGTGNYFLVLSNLDQSIGNTTPQWYRFETGTSMSAADVSGTLALMQQFYAGAFGGLPSPAMLKAMLINGARATGFYNYGAQNSINYEGWGLINLPDSLPPGITNQLNQSCSTFIQDQNPTNALATGDSQTFNVVTTNALPLHVTLAWTDPPGDPAAAIKLVNNLVLVVTNTSNPTNPIVYYGNDFPASSTVNSPHATNTPPVIDSINNVQNVNLQLSAGTNFSVTVMGYRVNVNAVTAQTNNVVQDYALVISAGNGQVPGVMTVTATPPLAPPNYPPAAQQITNLAPSAVGFMTSFQMLLNQFVGANTPLLGNNTVVFSTTAPEGFGPNNWQVTVGMTNQWHFYVVTNTSLYSNAAFVTFNPNAPEPDTLSIPREGVFGGSTANASRDADIDLYVTTDPSITNLNPAAISNCVVGTQVGATAGPTFAGASLGRGTTEFVVDTNSQSRSPSVYYIGVKSEDQMSAEYGFITIFSAAPFSTMQNGVQTVYGVPVPMNIPDGSPTVPGKGYVFGLAIYPETAGTVTVSNNITHQNFGDLIGTLTLNGGHADVLNNHDSLGAPPGPYNLLYDDSAGGGLLGSRPSDGPGTLTGYMGQQGFGVWMLTEVDDSLTQTGAVNNFTTTIQPHQDLLNGENFTIQPNSWFYGFIDVPPGATSLTITATNFPPAANPPLQLFVKFGSEPTTNSFDGMALMNNPGPAGPWGTVSLGPPLVSGRYFVGIFNPSPTPQSGVVFASFVLPVVPAQTIYNSTDTPIPILDDAVTTDSINVPDFQTISSMDVAIAVAHPRISDLVFHLISPDGTRDLLMENRGGTDPNGAGGIGTVTTNVPLNSTFEGLPATNYAAGRIVGGLTVAANQVSVQTDPLNAYPGNTNYLALANGTLSTTLTTVPGATYTLKFAYRGPGIAGWWRGESNAVAVDSAYGNNGALVGGVSYTTGEVDQAFLFTGSGSPSSRVNVPDNSAFILTNALTIEGWAWASNYVAASGGLFLFRGDDSLGLDPYWMELDHNNQNLSFSILQYNGTGLTTLTYNFSSLLQQWVHLAGTWDGRSGLMRLYVNGQVVAQAVTPFIPIGVLTGPNPGIGIGNNQSTGYNTPWIGSLDEVSLYNRALSASEILAIYAAGTAGKFDTNRFLLSARQSLAEAQISVNGVTTNIFGDNTVWQTYTVSFIATQTSTPLQIQGLEPGMLLDAASVSAVVTNYTYLVFTENTNLTTTPIKFAVPPFTFTPALGYVQWPVSTGGNGHWYKPVANTNPSGLTWNQGNQIAQNAGGYLATITSQAENDFVFGLINSSNFFVGTHFNGAGPAIGATNSVQGSITTDWYWETGEPWAYTSWNPFFGDPNNNFPAQARAIYFSGTQGVPAELWDDVDPNDTGVGGYVIERNSLPLAPSYLPEQSLDDAYDGENALGTWTLEIQDDRVGATNPAPQLLSWQLRFNYVTGVGIPPGTTETNIIPPNGWTYYQINVPTNADNATNILVFATGPLDVWFNPANNPIGSTPPDSLLMGGSTGGSSTLSTFSTPTNIVPGGVYYIGLYNPNAFAVTNGFEVNFHYFQTTPLTPGVPVTNTVAGVISGDGVDYYSIAVPANADYATNLLLFSTQPVNVWFNQNKAPVCLTPPDHLLIANATNGVAILSSNSVPPLMPGLTYYLAVQDTNANNATYALGVNFHFLPALTNGVPVTNTVPSNSFFYFTVTVPTNADYATNLLLFADLPVNVWFNQNGLPVGTNPPDSLLIGNATNGVSILSTNTVPPLVPGSTYYLGVQNTNGVPVTFALEVDFHLVIPNIITGPTITATNMNGTNGFLLKWSGPTNYQYTIQWKANLTSAFPWNTVSNPVINLVYIPPDGHYSWFDDGSLTSGWPPAKFYRVVADLLSGPITNSTPVTNVIVAGSIMPLTVTVPSSATAATNLLISATGPVNVYFNQTTQPTGNTSAGDVLLLSSVTGGTFVLTGSSVPPLVPGANYYLGLQNPGASNVTFVFQVNFGFGAPSTNPPSISSITLTNVNGTNAVLLKWVAPTNYQFQVEWATNLAPAIAWHTVPSVVVTWSGVVSPTNAAYGIFQYLDDGSLTGGWGPLKFYRLIEYPYSTPIPQTLTIINTAIVGSAVRFQWVAPTNYQYQVLWTTNLGLPLASWSILANPALVLSNGVYTFTDTNQTGPATSPKFFRLLEQ